MKKTLLKKGNHILFFSQDGWEYIRRANCDGIVVIVAMTSDKKVLLTEQYRVPIEGRVIELPAGLVNDQVGGGRESFEIAAHRELLEETGYSAQRFLKILEGPAGSGSSADIMTFYLAEGIIRTSEGGGDDSENIVVHEVALDQIHEWLQMMCKRGFFIDPKIYAGLYFLHKYNKPKNDITKLTR